MHERYKHVGEHRDLNAANVFVDENHRDPTAKMEDFGMSKCKLHGEKPRKRRRQKRKGRPR